MGCRQSASVVTAIPAERQRLSVGCKVNEGGQEASIEIPEEDRGLITTLADEDITGMLASKSKGRRRISMSSCEDDCRTAFEEKSFKEMGGKLSPEENSLGLTCRKGLKPENPNQDSWFVLKVGNQFSMYGVFDGHGQDGHNISNFVKDTLPKLMVKDPRWNTDELETMMQDTFRKTQDLVNVATNMRMFSAQTSGTTASVVVHDHERRKLTVAHVADSRAVLGRYRSKEQRSKDDMEAVVLTRDHKANLKDERARIEASGCRVDENYRIYVKGESYPGLDMTRCIGNLQGHRHCGLTAEPEVSEVPIGGEDHVLLVCSDGVWEVIEPSDAVKIVSGFAPTDAMKAADTLAKQAWDGWIKEEGGRVVDDITVIVAFLNQTPPE